MEIQSSGTIPQKGNLQQTRSLNSPFCTVPAGNSGTWHHQPAHFERKLRSGHVVIVLVDESCPELPVALSVQPSASHIGFGSFAFHPVGVADVQEPAHLLIIAGLYDVRAGA